MAGERPMERKVDDHKSWFQVRFRLFILSAHPLLPVIREGPIQSRTFPSLAGLQTKKILQKSAQSQPSIFVYLLFSSLVVSLYSYEIRHLMQNNLFIEMLAVVR